MDNIQIITLIAFVVGMIGVITPIIKLNTSITKLDSTLNMLVKRTDEDRLTQKELQCEQQKIREEFIELKGKVLK